jgi:hypothetical protein
MIINNRSVTFASRVKKEVCAGPVGDSEYMPEYSSRNVRKSRVFLGFKLSGVWRSEYGQLPLNDSLRNY